MTGHVRNDNTLIIDDRLDSFATSCPDNGVNNPEYLPLSLEAMLSDDITLLQLKHWFLTEKVKNCRDVRRLSKDGIFSTSMSDLVTRPKKPPTDLFEIIQM